MAGLLSQVDDNKNTQGQYVSLQTVHHLILLKYSQIRSQPNKVSLLLALGEKEWALQLQVNYKIAYLIGPKDFYPMTASQAGFSTMVCKLSSVWFGSGTDEVSLSVRVAALSETRPVQSFWSWLGLDQSCHFDIWQFQTSVNKTVNRQSSEACALAVNFINSWSFQ